MAHTPGPWITQRSIAGVNGMRIVSEPSGLVVARVTQKADKPLGQKEADATLIAAAPNLLEALKDAQSWLDYKAPSVIANKIANAIAKAEST